MPFNLQFFDLIERGEEYQVVVGGVVWRMYKMHSTDFYYLDRNYDPYYSSQDLKEVVFCFLMNVGAWEK